MGWRDKVKDVVTEGMEGIGVPPSPRDAVSAAGPRVEYEVIELREKLLDARGSAPSEKLTSLLNERASRGWRLRQVIAAEVAGVVGKREGWMVIFERDVP